MTALKRYSKPRKAGDQSSGGRGKLLRAHGELTRIQVLVRETLQNSWDAAADGWIPAYGVHVREASSSVSALLREHIFTGLDRGGELEELRGSLTAPDLHLIEIYDRGTTGLNGPVNPDQEPAYGEPNNFNAFVFDIGSSKPLGHSGGTFGFGKTATFEVSAAHAVLYWTRCDRGDGELEDRLIASALHEPYAIQGKRFTGAHWWGSPDAAEIVPLRGPEATELAEAIFETHFGEDETGTSILIIDPLVTTKGEGGISHRLPVRSVAEASELGAQMLDAMVTSAWPKLVPTADGETPLIVQFDVYGERQDVAAAVEERFKVFGQGLSEIRAEQLGEDWSTTWQAPGQIVDSELFEIRLRPQFTKDLPRESYFGCRTDSVAGHLYIAKALRDPTREGGSDHANQCCFMRSRTELVVMYEDLVDDSGSPFSWYGVFKPTPECDVHFAASEPSTHDDWNKNAPEDPASMYVVERALAQARHKARRFVMGDEARPVKEARSARQLARSLSGFTPMGMPDASFPDTGQSEGLTFGDGENGPSSGTPGGAGGGTSNSAQKHGRGRGRAGSGVTVLSSQLENGAWTLMLQVPGDHSSRFSLEAKTAAHSSEDSPVKLKDQDVSIVWDVAGVHVDGRTCEAAGGETVGVSIRPHIDVALRFDIKTVEIS